MDRASSRPQVDRLHGACPTLGRGSWKYRMLFVNIVILFADQRHSPHRDRNGKKKVNRRMARKCSVDSRRRMPSTSAVPCTRVGVARLSRSAVVKAYLRHAVRCIRLFVLRRAAIAGGFVDEDLPLRIECRVLLSAKSCVQRRRPRPRSSAAHLPARLLVQWCRRASATMDLERVRGCFNCYPDDATG